MAVLRVFFFVVEKAAFKSADDKKCNCPAFKKFNNFSHPQPLKLQFVSSNWKLKLFCVKS